jgi:gas vesicle protein
MGQDPSEIRNDIEETRARMGDTAEALGHKADVPGRTREAISDRVESVKSTFTGAKDSVSESTPSGGDVKQGAKQAVGIAKENPLGLAIGATAVGFVAGLFIPATRVENEKIGPMADQLKETVKETGQEAMERGKQVAQDVASQATDTAKESGKEQAEGLRDSAQDKVGSSTNS